MLSSKEFDRWCEQLNIGDSTRKIIELERSSEPSRRVKSGLGNWRGFYASTKMQASRDFESGNELAQIKKKLEHNDAVLEYFSQPRSIGLEYLTKSNKPYKCQHTPDFFVIREDGAGWVECKTEEKLRSLAEQSPNRYVQREDGTWSCPPGEAYATARGLFYELWSSAEINPTFIRNIDWLEDYYTDPPPSIDRKIAKQILALVKAELGITYADVLHALEGINPDHINILIATEQVYVDLDADPLGMPDQVHLFIDQTMASAYKQAKRITPVPIPEGFQVIQVDVGTSVSWDGQYWKVLNLGNETVSLINQDKKLTDLPSQEFYRHLEDGKIIAAQTQPIADSQEGREIILRARPEDHLEAQARLEKIQPWLGEDPPPYPPRSIRRWVDAYRKAKKHYGNGYIGLLPKQSSKNNQSRIAPEIVEFTHEFLKEKHETKKMRRAQGLYREFKIACQAHDPPFNPPSEKWFRAQIQKRSGYVQTLAREGSRAAKQQKPFRIDTGIPRFGELPWQDVQIDHTQLDLECISSLLSLETCNTSSAIRTDINLGRPWLTLAIDSCTKRILAVYLSFEEPSVRSCLMVVRILVKRYARLPRRFTIDNGAEFDSIDFNTLLAYYRCDKRHRPPGEPRYGAPVERVFKTTNEQFIHELQGQTRLMRDPRKVTKSVNPKGQAVWTLAEILAGLEQWVYSVYDQRKHSSLGVSPQQAYEMGIALGGSREIRKVRDDSTFKLLTTPSPKHGDTRTVQPNGRGVKIEHFYYWCLAFHNPELVGTSVRVKRDPFHPGTAYAFINGHWEECSSQYSDFLNGYTEKEIQIIAEDLRQRKAIAGKQPDLSEREIVEFMRSMEELEGALLQNRLRALENKAVIDRIEGNRTLRHDLDSEEAPDLVEQDEDLETLDSLAQPDEAGSLDEFEYFGELK